MVEAFYIASLYTSVEKMVTCMQGGALSRIFVTFVGGDFDKNKIHISNMLSASKACAAIFGNDPDRAPETHPEYLHAETHGSVLKPMQKKRQRVRRSVNHD
jgi:hypothetical protein